MRSRLLLTKVITAVFSVLLVASAASAQVLRFPVHEPEAAGAVVEVVAIDALISGGVESYYIVFGYWPQCWYDVVAEGLVQVPLTTTAGLAINPDDGSLDYLGDAMYVPPAGSSAPSIEIMVEIGDGIIHEKEISLPRSYSERFSTWMPQFNSLAGDFNRLKQFAIVHQLSNAVFYHSGQYGEPPESWNELLASEYSPIDHSSINPLTGDVFHGDGRANDILYEYLGDGFVTLLPVNESGETPWRFTY